MNESELLAMLAKETVATFHIVFLSKTPKSSIWRLLHDNGTVARDGFRAVIHHQIQVGALSAEETIKPNKRWQGPSVSLGAELVEFVFSSNRESCTLYVNRRVLAERRNVFHCLRVLRSHMISMETAAGDLDEPGMRARPRSQVARLPYMATN